MATPNLRRALHDAYPRAWDRTHRQRTIQGRAKRGRTPPRDCVAREAAAGSGRSSGTRPGLAALEQATWLREEVDGAGSGDLPRAASPGVRKGATPPRGPGWRWPDPLGSGFFLRGRTSGPVRGPMETPRVGLSGPRNPTFYEPRPRPRRRAAALAHHAISTQAGTHCRASRRRAWWPRQSGSRRASRRQKRCEWLRWRVWASSCRST